MGNGYAANHSDVVEPDFIKKMCPKNGMPRYITISNALEVAFARGQSTKIESTYFTITVYKKGTIHLTFNDDDILRRFNLAACIGKEWLPHDYGRKAYQNMNEEEKGVVDSFEGALSYSSNLNKPLFAVNAHSPVLQIAA